MAEETDTDETQEAEEPPTPDTYTPRRTRHETVELEAPHGETEEVTFKLIAGTTYTVLSGEKADAVIGWGAISQNAPAIRKEAADVARS